MRQVIMLAVVGLLTGQAPRLLAGEKSLAEKAAADWLYPGAKVISAGHGGAVSCVVQETADDVPKILKHYGDKLGKKLQERGYQTGAGSTAGVTVEYSHVGLKPGAASGIATVSTFKTKTAVATLVVTRPQDGKVTTITVTHVPLAAAK